MNVAQMAKIRSPMPTASSLGLPACSSALVASNANPAPVTTS